MIVKGSSTSFIFVLLSISAFVIGTLASTATPTSPSPAPVVYAVPQPSLQTASLASSIDNVPISGQCIISILHASETGGPVVPVSQESNSFKDCGVSPSIISTTSTTTTTGSSSTITTTSTSPQSESPSALSSSASLVSQTSSITSSSPSPSSGNNAGHSQFSSIHSLAISFLILPCLLASAIQLLLL